MSATHGENYYNSILCTTIKSRISRCELPRIKLYRNLGLCLLALEIKGFFWGQLFSRCDFRVFSYGKKCLSGFL